MYSGLEDKVRERMSTKTKKPNLGNGIPDTMSMGDAHHATHGGEHAGGHGVEEVADSYVHTPIGEFTNLAERYILTGYHKKQDRVIKAVRKLISDFEDEATANLGYDPEEGLTEVHKDALADKILSALAKEATHRDNLQKDLNVYKRDEEGKLVDDPETGEYQIDKEYISSRAFLNRFGFNDLKDLRRRVRSLGQLDAQSTDRIVDTVASSAAQADMQKIYETLGTYDGDHNNLHGLTHHVTGLAEKVGLKRIAKINDIAGVQAGYNTVLQKAAEHYRTKKAIQ